jgi:hypothetical protein
MFSCFNLKKSNLAKKFSELKTKWEGATAKKCRRFLTTEGGRILKKAMK